MSVVTPAAAEWVRYYGSAYYNTSDIEINRQFRTVLIKRVFPPDPKDEIKSITYKQELDCIKKKFRIIVWADMPSEWHSIPPNHEEFKILLGIFC